METACGSEHRCPVWAASAEPPSRSSGVAVGARALIASPTVPETPIAFAPAGGSFHPLADGSHVAPWRSVAASFAIVPPHVWLLDAFGQRVQRQNISGRRGFVGSERRNLWVWKLHPQARQLGRSRNQHPQAAREMFAAKRLVVVNHPKRPLFVLHQDPQNRATIC